MLNTNSANLSMPLNEILFQYHNLIFKIDEFCKRLEQLYKEHLVCKPGCSLCCEVERTVCSAEAHIIEQHLLAFSSEKIKRLKKLCKDSDETCPMLLRKRCVIYPVRPIICRTHGLPILYREAERSFIDYCRLNFKALPNDYEFKENDILDMNPFNVELIEIDKLFTETVIGKRWRPGFRQSLKNILFQLKPKQK